MGKIRAPHYRIVVADSRTKRDGRVIEEIGKYHPKEEPSFIEVNSERAQYWLGVGAQPSEPVTAILKVTGDWQQFKGEPAPEPMRVAEARRDKTDIFNDALKDAQKEPKTEAVTPRRSSRRPPTVDDAPVAEAAAAQPAVADASPVTDAASADDALVEDVPSAGAGDEGAAAAEPVAADVPAETSNGGAMPEPPSAGEGSEESVADDSAAKA